MTIATLRPNSTIQGGNWASSNASSIHSVVSDENLATYMATYFANTSSTEARLGLANLAIPAQSIILSIRTRIKSGAATPAEEIEFLFVNMGQVQGINTRYDGFIVTGFSGSEYTGPWYQSAPNGDQLTIDIINNLAVSLRTSNPHETRIHEVYLDVEYFPPPTVSVINPTGTIDHNFPEASWNYAHENFDQNGFEVEVRDSFGVTVLWSSGIVPSTAKQHKTGLLLDNGSYTLYVRVRAAASSPMWSDWDFNQFIVETDHAPIPVLDPLIPNENNGSISLYLWPQVGTPVAEQVRIERSHNDNPWSKLVDIDVPVSEYIDNEVRPHEPVKYRARSIRTSIGNLIYSPTSNEVSSLLELHKWILKDIVGDLGYLELDVEMDELDIEWEEDSAVFNNLGRPGDNKKVGYTVVKDTLRGDKFSIIVGVISGGNYDQIKRFRQAQRTLVLQAPTPDGFWYVVFGNGMSRKIINMNPPAYHQITIPVVEVERPFDVSG